MSSVEALRPRLDRIQFVSLVAGAAGSAVALVLGLAWPGRFFPAYMVAFLLAFGMGAGSLALLMLHRLVGGNWGRVIRRPLEAAAATLPALAVLFVPIILGMGWLYPWADRCPGLHQRRAGPRLPDRDGPRPRQRRGPGDP